MKATVLTTLLALSLVSVLGHAQGTASITFNLVPAGDLPPEQVIEMRYAFPPTDGSMPQVKVIQFCGGVQDPRIDVLVSA